MSGPDSVSSNEVAMTPKQQEAMEAVLSLVEFAYEQGFHEMGYEPEKFLEAEIERMRRALTGIASCSTCEVCRNAALKALEEA